MSQAATAFYFTSTPGSWVGAGQTKLYTAPGDSITAYRYAPDHGAYQNAVQFTAGGYRVTIVAPNYSLPTVGYYGSATRWPFMDNGAGLDFSGNGRGNNMLTGWFEVLQADYNADGSIAAFALNFKQHDEGGAAYTLGAVRYNSSIVIPEPSMAILIGLPALLLPRRRTK